MFVNDDNELIVHAKAAATGFMLFFWFIWTVHLMVVFYQGRL
jgi:hypothetical protein